MSKKQNKIKHKNVDNSNQNSSKKNSFAIIGTIVGIIVSFLAGSFIFYQVGKDNMTNTCEGEKIQIKKDIELLRKKKLEIQDSLILLQSKLMACNKANDSLIKISNVQNKKINELNIVKFEKVNKLIKEGESLQKNSSISIQTWRDNCIIFLKKIDMKLSSDFEKQTDYVSSSVGLRKDAIKNGIKILKTLK